MPSSSLVPDDPSVLLTTAGMQQFKKYYTGDANAIKDFGSLNTVSIQKCFRTSNIEEVGDETHNTFFEMLGNFSFEGYFKKEAIAYAYEFLTKEMGLTISFVTVFEGKDSIGVPKDEESIAIWKSLGISDEKIKEQGMEDVFWGPTGNSGPCGPTTEIYCRNGAGQDVEVWNLVFNQYFYPGSREELDEGVSGKKLELLKKPGVDTGMGLERLATVVQKKNTIFETDLFDFIMQRFPDQLPIRTRRILADHIRGIPFLISDGLRPSNKGAGYILRRLMRRVIEFTYDENIGADPVRQLEFVVNEYKKIPDYQNLDFSVVEKVFRDEYEKFMKTLGPIRREFEKEANRIKEQGERFMSPVIVFGIHQSTGATIDILHDLAKKEGVEINEEAFAKDQERHKEISSVGVARKFGGHGLLVDTGELKAANEEELQIVTRLHTATHLLQAALRKVLGEDVHQAGSDITPERTRFDFTFDRKLTDEEVRQTELLVQEAIRQNLDMGYKEMPFQEAIALGALYSPREKYPDAVKVYSAWDPKTGEVFSRELCGGPHVRHTGEVEGFRIGKQEAVSAGVRRIRGHLLKTS